ncbi:hypothetical protein AYI70_g6969 [Smittium culicis]|uniref:Post-transcriptional regulator MKT1 N-terminal domain-containing protein n=1 Tax=Smittium culicis TaxID=133412 RepID=A0A1R1XML6_9FUNG|nr:hypothetical protein AYI70_g6969 [Smittium culicis]
MYEDGIVRPLNIESCPNDLHLVIGHALPPQIYQLLSKGLIDTLILNSLLTGKLYEDVPTYLSDSFEYKRLVQEFATPVYTRSLALITPHLHAFYRNKSVHLHSFFKKIPTDSSETTPLSLLKNKTNSAPKKFQPPSNLNSSFDQKVWSLDHAEAAVGCDRVPGVYNPIKTKHAVKAYSSGKMSELALDVVIPVIIKPEAVSQFNGDIGWVESIINFDSWVDDSKLKDSLYNTGEIRVR